MAIKHGDGSFNRLALVYIATVIAILGIACLGGVAVFMQLNSHHSKWTHVELPGSRQHHSMRHGNDSLDTVVSMLHELKQQVSKLEQHTAPAGSKLHQLDHVSAAVNATQEAVLATMQTVTRAGQQMDILLSKSEEKQQSQQPEKQQDSKAVEQPKQNPCPQAPSPSPAPARVKRLVVSMSSFPGRAEFAIPTVYSIMYGKRVPDAFYFWVAVNVSRLDPDSTSKGQIPGPCKSVQDQFKDVLKVLVPPKDYGPATKLLPTLQVETDPDTVIVTIDDDTYYHQDTVYDLEQEIIARPGHAIVRSCELTFSDPKHDPPRWKQWKLDEGYCKGFMTAYASAAYRRSFFDDEIYKQELGPDSCLHHDDIWFSGHLWVRQVPVWILKPFVHAWPPMYHRPTNHMSISAHPDSDKKQFECLDYWGWLQDEAVRKKLLGSREPYNASAHQWR